MSHFVVCYKRILFRKDDLKVSSRFGPHEGGVTDLICSVDRNGNLAIMFTHTDVTRLVKLNQFVGKQYYYNTILDHILQDYPATASIKITDAAKKAINKQVQKNQQS